jgi:hypothetical protein
LAPTLFHRDLYASASGHARDMLEKWYFSYFSPDGRSPWDRIVETGYGPSLAGEIIGLTASLCPADLSEVATRLFDAAFRDELSPGWVFQRNLLNPDLREAGVAFDGFSFCHMEDFPYRYDLWVADFGARPTGPGTTLTGVVFADEDENGLYGMGEGLPRVGVALIGQDGVRIHLVTDWSGRFTAGVAAGTYQVEVTWGEHVFSQTADVAEGESVGIWVDAAGGI